MFLQNLTLLWKKYSPLEERLLAAVRAVLPPAARPIFDAQVAAITHVQRLPGMWSEISFYRKVGNKVDWSGVPRFMCADEMRLAKVTFTVSGTKYQATLTVIDGHIFSLATTPGPKSIAFSDWDASPDVRLLADPLRGGTEQRELENLPAAWKSVLERNGDQSPSGWSLYDAATAYRVTLDDAEYVVVGEFEGVEYLLYRADDVSGRLYYLEHYDGDPRPVTEPIDTLLTDRT